MRWYLTTWVGDIDCAPTFERTVGPFGSISSAILYRDNHYGDVGNLIIVDDSEVGRRDDVEAPEWQRSRQRTPARS